MLLTGLCSVMYRTRGLIFGGRETAPSTCAVCFNTTPLTLQNKHVNSDTCFFQESNRHWQMRNEKSESEEERGGRGKEDSDNY